MPSANLNWIKVVGAAGSTTRSTDGGSVVVSESDEIGGSLET